MATTKNATTLKKQVTTLTEENNKLRNAKEAVLVRVGGLRAHIVQNNVTDTKEIVRLLELIIRDS
jgi:hypothetical protein